MEQEHDTSCTELDANVGFETEKNEEKKPPLQIKPFDKSQNSVNEMKPMHIVEQQNPAVKLESIVLPLGEPMKTEPIFEPQGPLTKLPSIFEPKEEPMEIEDLSIKIKPILMPINGVVQPQVLPRPGRPGRNTNQTQYLLTMIRNTLWRNPNSYPFRQPVNSIQLNIPDYYDIIKHPMDMGTIKKRLENTYYWSSTECLQDFDRIFLNCYLYNKYGDSVALMGKALENIYRRKIKDMPKDEIEIYSQESKVYSKTADTWSGRRNNFAADSRNGRDSGQHGALHSSCPSPLDGGKKVVRTQKTTITDVDLGWPQPRAINSRSDQNSNFPIPQDCFNREKGVKRKAEAMISKAPELFLSVPQVSRNLKSTRQQQQPKPSQSSRIDMSYRHQISDELKACNEILKELIESKKHNAYASPFYYPVPHDAENRQYYQMIKNPMCLLDVKRKCDNYEYKTASEFASDIRLIFRNCFKYYHPDHKINLMGSKLLKAFEKKYANIRQEEITHTAEKIAHDNDLYSRAPTDKFVTRLILVENMLGDLTKLVVDIRKEYCQKKIQKKNSEKICSVSAMPEPCKNNLTPPKIVDPEDELRPKIVWYDELYSRMAQMSASQHKHFERIFKKCEPSLHSSQLSKIPIDQLQPATLKRIKRYISSCDRKNAVKHVSTETEEEKLIKKQQLERRLEELNRVLKKKKVKNNTAKEVFAPCRNLESSSDSSGSDSTSSSSDSSKSEETVGNKLEA